LLVIRDVRAEVCEQCGEAYFDPQTSRELDALIGIGPDAA